MTDALHHQLAAVARTHARCLCETKAFWPWRREVTCSRCVALTQFEMRQAAEAALKVKP